MELGEKIRQLRIKNSLTQEELASRTELSKGFISQLERDLASPSIATLMDILEALGSDIRNFFNETEQEKVVYSGDDIFIKKDEESDLEIQWLVTNAQKNQMEPILVTLGAHGKALEHDAHDGEEFGYVLGGVICVFLGERQYKAKKGDSFYFKSNTAHHIQNAGKIPAKVLWVSTPPTF